jgi:hypothetical protein
MDWVETTLPEMAKFRGLVVGQEVEECHHL